MGRPPFLQNPDKILTEARYLIVEFDVRGNILFVRTDAGVEEKGYAAELAAEGIKADRIRKYGFAFEGKNVLIDGA